MKPDSKRHFQLSEICLRALRLEPHQRAAFLDGDCRGDFSLRREVEAWLAHEEKAKSFLILPAWELLAEQIAGDGLAEPMAEDESTKLRMPVRHARESDDCDYETKLSNNLRTDPDRAQDSQKPFNVGPGIIGPGIILSERYQLQERIGCGGIGEVWLASDLKMKSLVAIKVLLNREPYFIGRFKDGELPALVKIKHPGVVVAFDVGELSDKRPYLVMQYIEGVTLRSLIKPEGMELARVGELIRQMGQAITAAHRQGVTHRDIKPENFMVQQEEEEEARIVLIDFGIAKVLDTTATSSSKTTRIAGTLAYIAPEQLEGRPTAASDIYALGVVAYEMVTGRKPFEHSTPTKLHEMQRKGVRVRPKVLRSDLPEAAQKAILKALEFNPENRHQQAQDFGEEFAQAVKKTDPPPVWKKRAVYVLALTLVAILVLGFWLILWRGNPKRGDMSTRILPPLAMYWHGYGRSLKGGKWSEINITDGMDMYSGDRFRLVISPNQDCYAYVINREPNGEMVILFPGEYTKMDNHLRKDEQYIIPDGTNWFKLDDETGLETLFILASYDPLDDLDGLLEELTKNARSEDLRKKFQNEVDKLEKPPQSSDGVLRTRGGDVVSRGIQVAPDPRMTEATQQDGRKVEQPMTIALGELNVVKRIQINHKPRP